MPPETAKPLQLTPLSSFGLPPPLHRLRSAEPFDVATGGGIVPGASALLCGAPGAGKSTLMVQVAASVHSSSYVTAEEKLCMVARRAQMVGASDAEMSLGESDDAESIAAMITERRPPLVIVDSLQTVHAGGRLGAFGTPSQVRACAAMLIGAAREAGSAIILVCHETKAGAFAGPRTVEHLVDVALRLEREPRRLTTIKNRFGPAGTGIDLAMTPHGLVVIDKAPAPVIERSAAALLRAIGRSR